MAAPNSDEARRMTTSGLMTAAMCYRVKYREYGDEGKPIKRHLHVGVLGVDKKNRGGAYPGGLRCKTLCQTVVRGRLIGSRH